MSKNAHRGDDDTSHLAVDFANDPDGLAYTLELAKNAPTAATDIHGKLQKMAAEKIWRAIAAGEAHDNTKLAWVEHVAKCVMESFLEGDGMESNERGTAALKVLGLCGHRYENARILQVIDTILSFQNLDLEAPEQTPLPTPTELLKILQQVGLMNDKDTPHRQKQKRVNEYLNKVLELKGLSREDFELRS